MKMDGTKMKNLVVQIFFDNNLIDGNKKTDNKWDKKRGSTLSAQIANKDFYKHSQILAKRYADKYGFDYVLFDSPYINVFNPTMEKFRLIEEKKWAEEYDNILYIDCDAFIYDDCPNIFEEYPQETMRVCPAMTNYSWKSETYMIEELGSQKTQTNYFNAGVLLFHKSSIYKLREVINYRERFDKLPYTDQSEFNYCVKKYDIPLTMMDRIYNSNMINAKIAHLPGQEKLNNTYHIEKSKKQAENKMENYLPSHLGGQKQGNVDVSLMQYVVEKFNIESLIDIGCGDGTAVKTYGEKFDLDYCGFDGDWTRLPKTDEFILHDFTEGKVEFDPDNVSFDCAYSVEFLEHVEEKYQDNYMDLFSRCNYAIVTAAPPGQPGRHHVNCRKQQYWIDVFDKYGFEFLEKETNNAKEVSLNKSNSGGPKNQYFKETGMIFRKK